MPLSFLPSKSLKIILFFVFCFILCVIATKPRNHYDVLGVPKDATIEQIRRAYHKLSLKYHPDKNKEKDAQEKFMEVGQAYETLSDPEKRKQYDAFGDEPPNGFPSGGGGGTRFQADFDPFDLFEKFFSKSGGSAGFNAGGFDSFFGGQNQGQAHFSFGGSGRPGRGRPGNQGGQQKERTQKKMFETDVGKTILLNNQAFDQVVSDNNVWAVLFFSAKEKKSQEVEEPWIEVSQLLRNLLRFGAINCDVDSSLCQEYKIESTPQVVMFYPRPGKPVKKNYLRYEGEITKSNISSLVERVYPGESITDLSSSPPLIRRRFMESSEKPKVILFTDRTTTPLLFKALANSLHSSIDFGAFLDSSAKKTQLFQKYSAKSPTVLFVDPSGALKEEVYNGKIGFNELKSFLLDKHRRWKAEVDRQKKNQQKEAQQEGSLQLTKSSFQQVCGETPLCLLLFTDNSATYQRNFPKTLSSVKDKLDSKTSKLGLVNCSSQEKFCNNFGVSKALLNPNKVGAVFLKLKRNKRSPVVFVTTDKLVQEIEALSDGLRFGETKLEELLPNVHLFLS